MGVARRPAASGVELDDTKESPNSRPLKKIKHEEAGASEDDSTSQDNSAAPSPSRERFSEQDSRGADDFGLRDTSPPLDEARTLRPTAFESSLPTIKSDEEAIEEYETFQASQTETEAESADNAASRLDSRKWVRGKSSLYVDAFNLALDTVLDEEAHLFDSKECMVFRQWRSLSYEAQFLFV